MHKLVILVEGATLPAEFDERWPQFLHLAEQMPGLQREATSRVQHVLSGSQDIVLIHELFFDSLEALQAAMASPFGRQAGQELQRMTQGKVVLLVGDHNEDELENILRYTQPKSGSQDEVVDN